MRHRAASRPAGLGGADKARRPRSRRSPELRRALQSILAQPDLHNVLAATLDSVVALFGFPHAGVYLLDRERGDLVYVARNTTYQTSAPLSVRLAPGHGPVGRAFLRGEPQVQEYEQPSQESRPWVAPETRSQLAWPIKSSREIVGVLDIQSPSPDALATLDVSHLDFLLQHAGQAIDHALDYGEAASRGQALNAVLEAVTSGVMMIDLLGVIKVANSKLAQLLGLQGEQAMLAGRSYADQFWPALSLRLKKPPASQPPDVVRLVARGDEVREDLHLDGPEGRIVHRLCGPVHDESGAIVGRIELYDDVTAERRATRQLQASAEIAASLTTSFDLSRVFSGLAEGLVRAVDFDLAVCSLKRENGETITARIEGRAGGSVDLQRRRDAGRSAEGGPTPSLSEVCAMTSTPLVLPDLEPGRALCGPGQDLAVAGMRQACLLPLVVGDAHLGMLAVGSARAEPRFNQGTLDSLLPIADFLTLAVNNALLFEELTASGEAAREEAARASALLEIARAVANHPDLQATCSAGAAALRRLFHHDCAAVSLWDSSRQAFVIASLDCRHAECPAPCGGAGLDERLATLVQAAVASGGVLVASDPAPGRHGPCADDSLVVVPLRSGEAPLGGLVLGFARDSDLPGERERAVLLGVANQMALGIQQAVLLAEAKQRANLLAGISRASRRLTSTLEAGEVLDEVVGFLSQEHGTDWAAVYLVDETTEDLVLRAQGGKYSHHVELGDRIRSDRGLLSFAIKEGRPIVCNDTAADPRFVPDEGIPAASEMCVPLTFNERVLGVLDLESVRGNAYSEQDLLAVQTLADYLAIAIHNAHLFQHVRDLHLATTQSLARAVEARDPYTRGHSARVAEFAVLTGTELGLSAAELEGLRLAAMLHDVGKIVVEDRVLGKRGPLDPVERAMMMEHPVTGASILLNTQALANLAPLIRSHHEWFDGDGYPDGLSGEEIPVGARVLSVADSFDAMTSDRPYRTALAVDEARARLEAGSGTQFDPRIVKAFLTVLAAVERNREQLWVDLEERIGNSHQVGMGEQVEPGDQLTPGRILPVHSKALSIMYRVSLETGSILQQQQLLQRILGILHDTMGGHKYVIMLLDQGRRDLVVEAEIGFGEVVRHFRVPVGQGVTGWVAEHGTPLVIKDVRREGRYVAGPATGVRSELAVPLVARGRVIGVLDVESDVPNAFTTADTYLLMAVAGQISTAIETAQQHEQVARAAIIDGLTGVYNHSHFFQRLDEELARGKRQGRPLVVALLDVDGLKSVNDRYGHLAGDAALRQIARLLRAKLRRSDIVARYGGDEFAVIMPETRMEDAELATQRFQVALGGAVIEDLPNPVEMPGVTVGLAAYPGEGDRATDLVARADDCLYEQKDAKGLLPHAHVGMRSSRTA